VNEFYVENGVGRKVVNAFNEFTENHGWRATLQHDIHPQMQLPQQGDEWWIADATRLGYVILTCDLAIARTESEFETIRRVGARLVGFNRAGYTGWQMIAGLSHHWGAIERHLSEQPPIILRLYAGATPPVRTL
jgi:hypothetical protein